MNPRHSNAPADDGGEAKDRVGTGSVSILAPTTDKHRELYADLIAHGVPVILTTPNTSWKPGSKKPDLIHPEGGEDAAPDNNVIANYAPGLHTAAMVTGRVLDCIDLDPKNGCDLETTLHRIKACGVTMIGTDVTPSGGLHVFVMSTGIRSTTSQSVGIDFCGGGRIPDDKGSYGRHLVYLPGATRPRYPGKDYGTTSTLDWDALAEVMHEGDERDALWTFLQGVGLNPRLKAAPTTDTVPGEALPEHLPEELEILLTDAGPTWTTTKGTSTDRSERFHHLVHDCKRAGLTQGQTVTAMNPWCEAVGKYVGRVAEEVARSWAKPDKITEDQGDNIPEGLRRVVLTCAADIEPLPTTWTWEGRLPTGSLGLIAGPEGVAKSTVSYGIAAKITRGTLPGIHFGTPKDVLIAATEDSWARTIVPRLIAADADLGRIWRVEVATVLGTGGYLTLPKDVGALAVIVTEKDAALLILDPLMSRLEAGLDSHKDAETRRALEPIAALADRTGMSVLGLIHFNKSGSVDVLNNVMASKAFTAVARSVSTVIRDPNDDTGKTRIFGTPKSNLGRDDLPLLPFQLSEHTFRNKAGDLIVTSRIEWLDERTGTIDDLMRQARDTNADRSITAEVADWLSEYLHTEGDEAKRSQIVNAARKEQYRETHLRRAAEKLGIVKTRKGFPASSWWALPDEAQSIEPQSGHSPVTVRGECITDLTDLTEAQSSQSGQSGQSAESTREMTGLDSGGVRVCEFCHRPLTGNPCEECGATQHALTVIHEAGLVNDRTAAVIEITEMETSA